MLRIRLRRVGRKKQPSYRIVVAESTAPRDGKFVEVVGFYNPRTQPETITVKEERVLYWLSVGAQPSESTARLLKKIGTLDRFARLKAGEPMEALVAEAQAQQVEQAPQTNPVAAQPAVEEAEAAAEEVAEEAAEEAPVSSAE